MLSNIAKRTCFMKMQQQILFSAQGKMEENCCL